MKVHQRFIFFDDGSSQPIRKIGKGSFSTAYVTTEGKKEVYVVTKDGQGDYAKEILVNATENAKSLYVPKVSFVGMTDDAIVYKMPLYRTPLRKGDSEKAWKQYRALERCKDRAFEIARRKAARSRFSRLTHEGYNIMWETVQCVERDPDVVPGLVRALDLLMNAAADYGSDWTFEFSPRNLATTEKGTLILLDVLFSMDAVERKRNKR